MLFCQDTHQFLFLTWIFSLGYFQIPCLHGMKISTRFVQIVVKFLLGYRDEVLHITAILVLHCCHLSCEMKSYYGLMRWNFITGLKVPNTQFFAKIVKYFRKRLHLGCLPRFWMRLCYVRVNCLFHWVKCGQIPSLFWSLFSRIRTRYGKIRSISLYSVRMRENTDQEKLRIWTLIAQCL